MKTPERCHWWDRSGVFIVNLEQTFTLCFGVPIFDLKQMNFAWAEAYLGSPNYLWKKFLWKIVYNYFR